MPGRTDSSATTDSSDAQPPGSDPRPVHPTDTTGTAPAASTARLPAEQPHSCLTRLLPTRTPTAANSGGSAPDASWRSAAATATPSPAAPRQRRHRPRPAGRRPLPHPRPDRLHPAAFLAGPHARPGAFDALLSAHVLEHLDDEQAESLLRAYLPYVRPGGAAVLITPQEAGHRAGPDPVRFTDFPLLRAFAESAGLIVRRTYSHPLPRPAGLLLRANAFVLIAQVPA
ncbi:class I SAM-dependent methyltransferase [Streptomyces lydicus]|nr:class I SAM-dependent methyltransferase [Streptomyces lydicus]